MKLMYCENCGTLITEKQPRASRSTERLLCDTCRAASASQRRRRVRTRDSGMIPARKFREARKLGGQND